MSESSEKIIEKTEDQGVEIMSVNEAIDFADGIKKTPEAKKEEVVEPVIEKETETVVDKKAGKKEPKVEAVEEVVIDKPTETVVENVVETPKSSYDDVLDDEDRAYLAFKKNNKGATRADYEESKVDYEKFDRKTLLRKSLREKYGITDSDSDLDNYIETELNIPMDASEAEMSLSERVALRKLTDEYINSKKEQQNKWLEAKIEDKPSQNGQEEIVTLENGQTMPKKDYELMVENRNNYLKGNQEALNRVNATSFKIEVDDNGEKRELEYSYTFDKEDKHRMLSISSDLVANFNKTYTKKDGIDHDGINIDHAWADRNLREKMLKSYAQSIRAEAFEESLKEQGNITLGKNKELSKQETKGVKYVPLNELLNNY